SAKDSEHYPGNRLLRRKLDAVLAMPGYQAQCSCCLRSVTFSGAFNLGDLSEAAPGERDLMQRTINNCLRQRLIIPCKRSATSSSLVKPSRVAGSPTSISS